MRWLSLALAIVTLWIAIWILIPAPTYFFLTFSVGGPEVSAWLIVGALVGIAAGAASFSGSIVARAGVAGSVLALLIAGSVWARVPGTLSRFDEEMKGVVAEPEHPL